MENHMTKVSSTMQALLECYSISQTTLDQISLLPSAKSPDSLQSKEVTCTSFEDYCPLSCLYARTRHHCKTRQHLYSQMLGWRWHCRITRQRTCWRRQLCAFSIRICHDFWRSSPCVEITTHQRNMPQHPSCRICRPLKCALSFDPHSQHDHRHASVP